MLPIVKASDLTTIYIARRLKLCLPPTSHTRCQSALARNAPASTRSTCFKLSLCSFRYTSSGPKLRYSVTMASGLDSVTPYNLTTAFDCRVAHRPASSRKSCGTRRECTISYIILFTKMEEMGNRSKTKLK